MKLPEWFYHNHAHILRAYWEGSHSKYSPWAVTYVYT